VGIAALTISDDGGATVERTTTTVVAGVGLRDRLGLGRPVSRVEQAG
jgi:hypothetical protein